MNISWQNICQFLQPDEMLLSKLIAMSLIGLIAIENTQFFVVF